MANTDTRFCSACKQHTIHNRGKKEGENVRWRCTYCGHPVTTNQLGKKEYQDSLRNRQVRKLEDRRKLGLA